MSGTNLSAGGLRAVRKRLRGESGFSMIVLLMLLLVGSLLSVAAYDAASGDIPLSGSDQDRKQAYSAAEAGVEYYAFHLAQDNAYWTNCTNVPAPGPGQPSPVNQAWNGTGTDPRTWRAVPGSEAEYTIELLPATGKTSCDPANARGVDARPTRSTFQIRATGRAAARSGASSRPSGARAFLDYLYFTDYETLDPVVYARRTDPDEPPRSAPVPRAGRPDSATAPTSFASGDDDRRARSTPTTTSSSAARRRSAARRPTRSRRPGAPGWSTKAAAAARPNFVGTFKTGAPVLAMPADEQRR